MSLGFASPNKIIFFHQDKIHVQMGTIYDGQICGSSLNRKKPKAVLPVKYCLKSRVNHCPDYYKPLYIEKSEPKPQLLIDGIEIAKQQKFINKFYELKEPYYIRLNKETDLSNIGLHIDPSMYEIQTVSKPKQLPYHQRPDKQMSDRTRSKIKNKIAIWVDKLLNQNGRNPDKLNFQFFTFTVTTPNFDHEKTVLAYRRFMQNYKDKCARENKPFNYLWVAEKQNGSRSLKIMQKCQKFIADGINVEYNQKRYELFKQKSENPTNNIHYHMLVDRYHDLNIMRNYWLRALEYYGAARYNAEGRELASALDHKKVDKSGSPARLSNYLAKYMSKSDSGLKCQLWHCTNKLSSLGTSQAVVNRIDIDALKSFIDAQNERLLTLC